MRAIAVVGLCLLAVTGFAQKSMADMDKKERAMLASLEKTQVAAKAAHAKKPSADTKKSLIAANLKLADAVLVSPALGPKDKYPKSLRLYREVKALDPANKAAKEKIALIEGIYKSMGRPIPK